MEVFQRSQEKLLWDRLHEPIRLMQVLLGPRQVAKTTLVLEVLNKLDLPHLYVSADDPLLSGSQNLEKYWAQARELAQKHKSPVIFVIDEIHKYENWSAIVKSRWDEDRRKKHQIYVVILGSAPLLIQKGLADSLAGRFEVIDVPHWSFLEMRSAFDFDLETYALLGGYPGGAAFARDEKRWRDYMKNSLIETTISRDVLLLTRIDKPALLRRLFYLCAEYSGQILSYQKMLGQLQNAGNTTTLAHYLDLLGEVRFVKGLQKFSGSKVKMKSSSPKLQVFNTALFTAISDLSFQQLLSHTDMKGRLYESMVGAHLLNTATQSGFEVQYWREGNFEVDFVLTRGKKLIAIELKSGRRRESIPGLALFQKKFNPEKTFVIGSGGYTV